MPELEQVRPKYLQIAGHIRDQITRGDLRAGDEVPSERELASAWSVARPTAARALESLRQQGLVEARQGSGTFVRANEGVPRARERYDRARDLGTMYGTNESVEFLAAEIVTGPEHVTRALQVPAGSSVARRQRLLRGEEGRPIELSTSWFTSQIAEQAPRLVALERLRGGTGKYIGEVTGRKHEYARDQVSPRLATAEELRLLELADPAAVLVYRLTAYDADDRPVQFDDAVYPPERWAFKQEYSLPQ